MSKLSIRDNPSSINSELLFERISWDGKRVRGVKQLIEPAGRNGDATKVKLFSLTKHNVYALRSQTYAGARCVDEPYYETR